MTKITLRRIDSEKTERTLLSDIFLQADLDRMIATKTESDYYQRASLSTFGDFMIISGGRTAGMLKIIPTRCAKSDSDDKVDICFDYWLVEQHRRSGGAMTQAIKLALQCVNEQKDKTITYFEGDLTREYSAFTAHKIGEVYAEVVGISNYPSLSCCLQAGGKIAHVQSGAIHVTFVKDSSSEDASDNFSDEFASLLKDYSKTLCTLGFDANYTDSPPDLAQKHAASVASKAIFQQAPDRNTKAVILTFIRLEIPECVAEWLEDMEVMRAIQDAGLERYLGYDSLSDAIEQGLHSDDMPADSEVGALGALVLSHLQMELE